MPQSVTASGEQATVRRERRIIERPRLIKLLDESDAPTILLLAPAGYGKTTLARQWAKTLSRAIWVTLTPAHRDVVTIAEDVVAGIEKLGGGATEFIREYLRAQTNPQRAARDVGVALATQINEVTTRWLIIDDCHEIAGLDEPNTLLRTVLDRFEGRVLLSSRVRPEWLTHRRVVYGEVDEFDRHDLAMTRTETDAILGSRSDLAQLRQQAEGWPAVLSLAAAVERPTPPEGALPDALHHYLADELFHSASPQLREDLVTLALLPRLDLHLLARKFQQRWGKVLLEAGELGFIGGESPPELHPLLREFLLSKLVEAENALERVRATIRESVDSKEWEHALSLLLKFQLNDLIDQVLTEAFAPLASSGRLGTLSSFAADVRLGPEFPPPTIDLIDAEVALRDGQLELAIDLAGRAHERLPNSHSLRSRTSAIAGHGHFLLAAFDSAETAFTAAETEAVDPRDAGEAIHGLVLTKVFGERDGLEPAMSALADLRHTSPTHLLRFATAELNRRRFAEGLSLPLGFDEAAHTFARVDDPRARTSFTYSISYAFALRADYEEASKYLASFLDDVRAFDLEFALPYANWTAAMIALGQRRFGEAEQALQSVEDAASRPEEQRHGVNARSLRARLLLQLGQPTEALTYVLPDIELQLIPSWLGEYLGTRALVLACLSRRDEALRAAEEAVSQCRAVEVAVFAATAKAVSAASAADRTAVSDMLALATRFQIWDPVVCALRASPTLADVITREASFRPAIEDLYERSRDAALAKRAGFRTRSRRQPGDVLSPREREVLGLIARGLKNREISEALFIANSTTKVHVRHILEKLGVRTRAEAVARYEKFTTRNVGNSPSDE